MLASVCIARPGGRVSRVSDSLDLAKVHSSSEDLGQFSIMLVVVLLYRMQQCGFVGVVMFRLMCHAVSPLKTSHWISWEAASICFADS